MTKSRSNAAEDQAMTDLTLPAFLDRTSPDCKAGEAKRGGYKTGAVSLPKRQAPTKADAFKLERQGWSRSQIAALTRDEARIHVDLGAGPGARFGTKVTIEKEIA